MLDTVLVNPEAFMNRSKDKPTEFIISPKREAQEDRALQLKTQNDDLRSIALGVTRARGG